MSVLAYEKLLIDYKGNYCLWCSSITQVNTVDSLKYWNVKSCNTIYLI